MTALVCWYCGGRGYVSDGQPEDGMMTGRMTCPKCDGLGHIDEDDINREITRMWAVARGFIKG